MGKGRVSVIQGAQVEQAKELYQSGLSYKQIGKVLGVSRSAVDRKLHKLGVEARPDSCRRLLVDENFFATVDTPEKAYWLGFLATDGNICGTRVCVNIIDKEHLVKFGRDLGLLAPEISTHYRKTAAEDTHLKAVYSIFRLQFRSKKMVSDLLALGLGERKTFTIKPWDGPDHLQKHYWRGCIDGDGCIFISERKGRRPAKSISFCGNLDMVQGFCNFISRTAGILAKAHARKSIYNATVGDAEKVQEVCDLLYDCEGPRLDRKYELAMTEIKRPVREGA